MIARSYASKRMMDMDPEEHCLAPKELVFNMPHYHAFIVLGKERLFACHLTQLWCEVHMYQFVMEFSLPETSRSAFIKQREAYPSDSFFLTNALADSEVGSTRDDPMTLPELAGRLRTSFVGNVFHGIPNHEEYKDWPWIGQPPVAGLGEIQVDVERIVHFRPFSDTMNYPGTPTYLLFGAGTEGHMVHYQTKLPDYDHIASLRAAPSWLANDMLAAGILVDLPDVPESAGVRCTKPFGDGAAVQVRYRSAGPRRPITIDHTYWFCTRICNDHDPCRQYEPCGTPTPGEYLST